MSTVTVVLCVLIVAAVIAAPYTPSSILYVVLAVICGLSLVMLFERF